MKEIFDTTGPANPVERKILERHVQSKSVKWWMSHNRGADAGLVWARKFSSPAQRSVPDYLFACCGDGVKPAAKFAVEFKAFGKTSTEAQIEEQQKMREAGWDVYECDSVEKFKEIARHYL